MTDRRVVLLFSYFGWASQVNNNKKKMPGFVLVWGRIVGSHLEVNPSKIVLRQHHGQLKCRVVWEYELLIPFRMTLIFFMDAFSSSKSCLVHSLLGEQSQELHKSLSNPSLVGCIVIGLMYGKCCWTNYSYPFWLLDHWDCGVIFSVRGAWLPKTLFVRGEGVFAIIFKRRRTYAFDSSHSIWWHQNPSIVASYWSLIG